MRTDNDVASKEASAAAAQITAAIDQVARQKTGETTREILPATDVGQASLLAGGRSLERSSADDLRQQLNRISIENLSGRPAEGSIQNAAQHAAQRAVTAYTDVATQEHRDELVQLLGIDVFA